MFQGLILSNNNTKTSYCNLYVDNKRIPQTICPCQIFTLTILTSSLTRTKSKITWNVLGNIKIKVLQKL